MSFLIALVVTFPHLGRVTVRTRLTETAVTTSIVKNRRTIETLTFAASCLNLDLCDVRTATYRLRGLDTPIVLVVADGAMADGGWIAVGLFGERDGRVAPLLDPGIDRFEEDGICFEPERIVIGRHLIGNDAVMEPHHVLLTTFVAKDGRLVKAHEMVTKRRYTGMHDAVRELDRPCVDRVTQLILK